MKRLLATLLCFAPSLAFAMCDLEMSSVVTYGVGEAVGKQVTTWNGLEAADVTNIKTKGKSILDVASKVQDKGGKYTIVFNETTTCDNKPVKAVAVEVSGVTIHGMSAILRASTKVGEQLLKMGEDEAKKGKKRAWGKE